MMRSRPSIFLFLAVLAGLSGSVGTARAEGGCAGAAAQAAADTGGQVLSVSSRSEGGRTVCVVTLLVPDQDGGRPRKRTLTLPQ